MWAHRIYLESLLREDNSFVTLTYAPENVPLMKPSSEIDGVWEPVIRSEDGLNVIGTGLLPTLVPKHLTLMLKRLREQVKVRFNATFRYYAVGEYGDETGRPHYHLALFGYPVCRYGGSDAHRGRDGRCPCDVCDLVHVCWGQGRISVDALTIESAQYVAGYVTKKLTAKDDERLEGRYPEFARMSRRPGIGVDMMHEIASELLADTGFVDVPAALRHGGRSLPLGQFLRRKLRVLVGRDEKTPDVVIAQMAEELRDLYEASGNDETGHKSEVFKDKITLANKQLIRNFEAKRRIYEKRKVRL